MNDNTRRQWERYCFDNPVLDANERKVLFWMVHMHSAAEGFTRPGVRLLATLTALHTETVANVMARLRAYGAIELKQAARGRRAALWIIPWLHNLRAGLRADLRAGLRPGFPRANPRTSSTPTEYYARGPASRRGPAATHPALQPALRAEIIADDEYVAAMGLVVDVDIGEAL